MKKLQRQTPEHGISGAPASKPAKAALWTTNKERTSRIFQQRERACKTIDAMIKLSMSQNLIFAAPAFLHQCATFQDLAAVHSHCKVVQAHVHCSNVKAGRTTKRDGWMDGWMDGWNE
jgi:hypothetical protein